MDSLRVALRLGQQFASVDPNAELKADGYRYDAEGRGPFPGWYPVRFNHTNAPGDANAAFVLSQPNPGDVRLLIRPEGLVAEEGALSADATEFSGDIASQFGVKPRVSEPEWGGYEAFNGWTLRDQGIDIVLVQYDRDGQKYTSANLTVVVL
jgi:hypothetical protein